MKKHSKTAIRALAVVVTVASIYLFAPWKAGLLYISPLPDTVQEQLDDAVAYGIDGILLYAHTAGKAPQQFAAGWHDRTAQQPANPDALFKIGSIRKLYTVSAFTKLVAAGRIAAEDTLADHLPELRGRIQHADNITLRMMVQHRSGIPNYTDTPGFNWGETLSRDAALALVLDAPADFAPDSDYSYSNTNYLLLRRIMSKLLGYDHHQFIKDEILAPLGLKRTYTAVSQVPDPAQLMSGYHVGYDMDFKELDHGFVASAADVATFLRALNEGTLFTRQERDIYAGLYKYEHTGWVLGYNSAARYIKDTGTVVVQFINTTGDDTVLLHKILFDRITKILQQRGAPA